MGRVARRITSQAAERGEGDAGEGDEHEAVAQHVEHVVGLGHLAGDLHRAAAAARDTVIIR